MAQRVDQRTDTRRNDTAIMQAASQMRDYLNAGSEDLAEKTAKEIDALQIETRPDSFTFPEGRAVFAIDLAHWAELLIGGGVAVTRYFYNHPGMPDTFESAEWQAHRLFKGDFGEIPNSIHLVDELAFAAEAA